MLPDRRVSRAVLHLQHIQNDALPRCFARIERADERLSGSIERELESTQRILDRDASPLVTVARRERHGY
jgi:hypothetical protein